MLAKGGLVPTDTTETSSCRAVKAPVAVSVISGASCGDGRHLEAERLQLGRGRLGQREHEAGCPRGVGPLPRRERDAVLVERAVHAVGEAAEAEIVGLRRGPVVGQLDRELGGGLRLRHLAVGAEGQREAVRRLVVDRASQGVEGIAESVYGGQRGRGRGGRGDRGLRGGDRGDIGGEERIGRELRDEVLEVGERLALGDGIARILHQVRQRDSQVVEHIGEAGLTELSRGHGRLGDRQRPRDDDLHGDFNRRRHRRRRWAIGRCQRRLQEGVERRRGTRSQRDRLGRRLPDGERGGAQ